MNRKKRSSLKTLSLGAGATLAALGAAFGVASNAAEVVSVTHLPAKTHIHGLAVDREDPSRVLIATHHGLFRAGPDGKAERMSQVQDFMGFNPHPSDPRTHYASGHPATGGNLGFITSTDGGRTWRGRNKSSAKSYAKAERMVNVMRRATSGREAAKA